MAKYLDDNGLSHLWAKIKAYFVADVTWDSTNRKLKKTKAGSTSDVVTISAVGISNDYGDLSNKPTIPSGVEKTTTTPLMDGTAAIGSETKFAAGDHVHPTDTSRVPTSRTVNGKALSSDVTLLGTDIEVSSSDNTDITTALISVGQALATHYTFSNVEVGSTTISADSMSDTLELVAGSNVTLTPDATNDRVTIAATDTTYNVANYNGINSDGLMSSADKHKLDSLTITNGIIDSSNLPSYVDDVIEAYPRSGQTELSSTWLSTTSGGSALTPETGKIYVLMADSTSYAANTQFRWGGTAYVKLADGGVSAITNAEIDTICV